MAFPLIVQAVHLGVVILLVFSGNGKWGRWLCGGTQYERESEKAELTVPHALHLSHPAYRKAQPQAEEGHTWPSEKKTNTPEQGATGLLITCGEPRQMRQSKRQQAKYFKQSRGDQTERLKDSQWLQTNGL